MRKTALFILIAMVCTVLIAHAVSDRNREKQVVQDQSQPGVQQTVKDPVIPKNPVFIKQVYGYSGDHQELQVFKIGASNNTKKKLLCVFAIHGFEDAFYRDGRLLSDIAGQVVDYFKEHSQELGSYQLLVVPSANPDGQTRGWTCNGPGRCQLSLGIDMNMDFDYLFKARSNSRNLTGSQPFASPESLALRDLVLAEKPDIIIDFHGWVNSAAGDPQISGIFCRLLGLSYNTNEGSIRPGFFSGWAGQYARAVLVEYPDPFTGHGAYEQKTEFKINYNQDMTEKLGYSAKTVQCIQEIIKDIS